MAIVGFIGLGIMGRPMLNNLLRAGHTAIVYGTNAAKLDACVADGAQRGISNSDVAARSEFIFTMLPDGPEVEQVILGPDGVLAGARPGALIIEMSSINPLVSQRIAAAVTSRNIGFLDAPVSGGEPKAIDGTLAIMVGGSEFSYGLAEPLLKCMGSTVTHMGPVGAGNVTKLANQIIVACNIAAVGEALTLSTRCGLDPHVVVSAIKNGLAGSTVLNVKGPTIIARNFKPGFKLRLHRKDLRNALLTANDVKLPITTVLQQMLTSLVDEGKGELDHSAIVTYTETLSGVEIGLANKNV